MPARTEFRWTGPGWYAGCQEGTNREPVYTYYCIGTKKNVRPETRNSGLGTPDWYEAVPEWAKTSAEPATA